MLILPMPFGAFQPPKPAAAYGCKRLLYFEGYEDIGKAIALEKQRKGWRREKKLNLIRTIHPEFKDLAQTWGLKMITVFASPALSPRPSGGYGSKILYAGFGG